MTPTLAGRIQTRIFLLLLIGIPWTLIIGPALSRPEGASLGDLYEVLFTSLAIVILAGIVWEFIYHGLQQFRWEKDWPTMFGLLTGINEGIVTWIILTRVLPDDLDVGSIAIDYREIPVLTFVIAFATTWILVWLFANGPMRVLALRWRFRGGRLV